VFVGWGGWRDSVGPSCGSNGKKRHKKKIGPPNSDILLQSQTTMHGLRINVQEPRKMPVREKRDKVDVPPTRLKLSAP